MFNHNFGGRQWTDISFPVPIIRGQSVLVESFLPGCSVQTIVDRVKALGDKYVLTREDLLLNHFVVCRGGDLYLKMLLQDNLMHADLHPGNILIGTLPDGRHHISMVDAGLVAKLLPVEQHNFLRLFIAVGEGDGREAAESVL